jgi:hypothetical protein
MSSHHNLHNHTPQPTVLTHFPSQPVHLVCLQEMFLFDWATMPVPSFAGKLATVWLGFFVTMGLPVSAFTFDLHKELFQCLIAASAGSSFIVTVLVWRLYLGWQVRVLCVTFFTWVQQC